jgi:aspartyl-tRNA(Asn)/glutamyl-tRNA(Gln) amidotransferase subunit B
MRSKEDALDYRYFPEPDLPELQLNNETLKQLNNSTIIIPHEIIKQFQQDYGFNKEYINAIISDKEILNYFLELETLFAKANEVKSSEAGKGNEG